MTKSSYQLPCLLGDDSCQFVTIQLEFSQAKEILEMHMKLVHPVPDLRSFECNNCEKDNATKDILEDKVDDETSCNVQNETAREDSEIFRDNSDPVESIQVAKAVEVATEEDEALLQSDIADVTLVRDDRDEVGRHSVEHHDDDLEADYVEKLFRPVDRQATCRNCGSYEHSSKRYIRRRSCPAWNRYCSSCHKRGHSSNVCKNNIISEHRSSHVLSPGELAALYYTMAEVSNSLKPIHKVKIPHMIHDQLEWILSRPPQAPNIQVSVKVDTKAYLKNNIKPPSAYKHREVDVLGLADTGAQVTTIGQNQLSRLGLSKKDLLEADMTLRGAGGASIKIHGALFIEVSARNQSTGVTLRSKQLCYVCDGEDKIILSRQTCEQLRMIPSRFPEPDSFDKLIK